MSQMVETLLTVLGGTIIVFTVIAAVGMGFLLALIKCGEEIDEDAQDDEDLTNIWEEHKNE